MPRDYKKLYKHSQRQLKAAVNALDIIKNSVIANQDFSKREAIQALSEIKQFKKEYIIQ